MTTHLPTTYRMAFAHSRMVSEPIPDAAMPVYGKGWFRDKLQRLAMRILRRWGKVPEALSPVYETAYIEAATLMELIHKQIRHAVEQTGKKPFQVVLGPEAMRKLAGEIAAHHAWSAQVPIGPMAMPDGGVRIMGCEIISCPWYNGEPLVLPNVKKRQ